MLHAYQVLDEDTWIVAARTDEEALEVFTEQCATPDPDDPPRIERLSLVRCALISFEDEDGQSTTLLAELQALRSADASPQVLAVPSCYA